MHIALVRAYKPLANDMIAQPLGIMALDAWLRREGRTDIRLHDMRLGKRRPDELAPVVLRDRPGLVGISALSIEKSAVHALARELKRRAPEVVIVVGGPYATSSSASLVIDENIDYAVVGEGERTFSELLGVLESGGDPALVDGLAFRRGGRVVSTSPRALIDDLDALPLPSWDRIDMPAYQRVFQEENLTGEPWAVIQTSRGCPFRCTYCHDVHGKKFRAQSAERVLSELEVLVEDYGVRELLIFDDIFNFHKDRLVAICDGIVERGWQIGIQFPNGLRTDILDRRVLEALRRAGTYRISVAIESASERIQKQVRKHLNLPRVERNMEIADELGLLLHGFFMLGFPSETREEILATIDYACRSRLHTAAFFLVTPFEGSELADEYLEPAQNHVMGEAHDYYDNVHDLAAVSPTELKWLQRYAYAKFYGNPRRVAQFAWKLPEKRLLVGHAKKLATILMGRAKVHGADAESFSRPWGSSAPEGPLRDSLGATGTGRQKRVSLPVFQGPSGSSPPPSALDAL